MRLLLEYDVMKMKKEKGKARKMNKDGKTEIYNNKKVLNNINEK